MTPALWSEAGVVLSAALLSRDAAGAAALLFALARIMPLTPAAGLAAVALCAYLSARAHLRRRAKRRAERLMLASVEAMIDEAKVTLSPERILEAGVRRAQSGPGPLRPAPGETLVAWAAREGLDGSGPLRAVLQHAAEGLPLAPYLTLVADELKDRGKIAAEQDAATAALTVVTYLFLAAVLVALSVTLASRSSRSVFFGSPSGSAILLWVFVTTALCLALPLVRDRVG